MNVYSSQDDAFAPIWSHRRLTIVPKWHAHRNYFAISSIRRGRQATTRYFLAVLSVARSRVVQDFCGEGASLADNFL
jgi:hypothetical protein